MDMVASAMPEQTYCIGEFGDKRLSRTGAQLFSRMVEQETVCLRQLGRDWATEKRFGRWLHNPNVTRQEIMREGCLKTGKLATGLSVLAIQDTSELNYQKHSRRSAGLGKVGNNKDAGLFIHPVLVLDARSGACLGLAHQHAWVRTKAAAADYTNLPIEEKESWRWLQAAQAAKKCLDKAEQITIVGDRESDIYEEWDRIPDGRTHLLTRVCRDRKLADGTNLFDWLEAQPAMACYEFEVAARSANESYVSAGGRNGGSGKRTAHRAQMDIRYGQVSIVRPAKSKAVQKSIALRVVEVRELGQSVVEGEEPIHWRLLTTHPIHGVEDALQIVDWYRERWQIEQLFRTLKKQGLDMESSQVEEGENLMKLASAALQAAVRTLQLTAAREGKTDRPATDVFEKDDIEVLENLQPQLEGRTDKQKNPHQQGKLAWAAWTIARLGGWKGYASQVKPGPITMLEGLKRFYAIAQGWRLAKMWV